MSGQQQLPEDKRAWLQELDIGVEATQSLADAWGEDGDMRGLSIGALSLMLSTRNDLAMKAFTNRGVSPLVIEALIVRLQHGETSCRCPTLSTMQGFPQCNLVAQTRTSHRGGYGDHL